jgi:rod shape-determining protein MreD
LKRTLGLVALGLGGLLVQGAGAALVPAWALPDFALLVAVSVAVVAGGPQGLVVATLVGYAADLLSRSLLGQHAALAAMAYVITRVVALQLDLLRPGARLAFVALLSFAWDLGHAGVGSLFSGDAGLDAEFARAAGIHAAVNALASLVVLGIVGRAAARLAGDDEAPRRALRVAGRGPVARRGLAR